VPPAAVLGSGFGAERPADPASVDPALVGMYGRSYGAYTTLHSRLRAGRLPPAGVVGVTANRLGPDTTRATPSG